MGKKEKLSIAWCDNGSVDSLFMDGILTVLMSLPNINIELGGLHHLIGNQIAKQRQQLVEEWYKSEIDWLLWVDSDVVITPEILDLLWRSADKDNKPVVSGVYFVSPNPNHTLMIPVPCIFKMSEDAKHNEPIHPMPENTLIKIDVAGLGLTLMHRSVITKIKDKYNGVYFDIGLGEDNRGEDVSFFLKLKEQNIPVYAHTGAIAQHIKRFVFDQNYYATWWNFVAPQVQQQHPEGLNFVV